MDKWEMVGFIGSSNARQKVLFALENPTIPSLIAKKTRLHATHVSRALHELEKQGLIECKTPKLRKGKIYQASPKTIWFIKTMNKCMRDLPKVCKELDKEKQGI